MQVHFKQASGSPEGNRNTLKLDTAWVILQITEYFVLCIFELGMSQLFMYTLTDGDLNMSNWDILNMLLWTLVYKFFSKHVSSCFLGKLMWVKLVGYCKLLLAF